MLIEQLYQQKGSFKILLNSPINYKRRIAISAIRHTVDKRLTYLPMFRTNDLVGRQMSKILITAENTHINNSNKTIQWTLELTVTGSGRQACEFGRTNHGCKECVYFHLEENTNDVTHESQYFTASLCLPRKTSRRTIQCFAVATAAAGPIILIE